MWDGKRDYRTYKLCKSDRKIGEQSLHPCYKNTRQLGVAAPVMVLPPFAKLPSAASSAGRAVSAAPPFYPPPAGGRPLYPIILPPLCYGITRRSNRRVAARRPTGLPPGSTAGHMAAVGAMELFSLIATQPAMDQAAAGDQQ